MWRILMSLMRVMTCEDDAQGVARGRAIWIQIIFAASLVRPWGPLLCKARGIAVAFLC